MKNILSVLFLLSFFTGCDKQKSTHQETVSQYYASRDIGNYNELKILINDSITITAGDFVMPYDHDSFHEQFKWDSIFKPAYEVVGLEEKNDQIIASVRLKSVRNTFLKNEAMTCDYKISFHSGKISKIEELDCKDVDWSIWQKERDSLVGWIKENHPELDGFINDMTMRGAMNYVKAIGLYEAEKSAQ